MNAVTPIWNAEAETAAAGVLTHDFNHLMTIVLAAAERLAAELPEGSAEQALARVCQDAAERSARLLDQMVSPDATATREADVADAREAATLAARLVRQAAPESIQIVVCAPEPLPCSAEPTALERAMLNLALNAVDATSPGGTVTLSAGPAWLGAVAARRLGLEPGRYARVSVADTGHGMSTDVMTLAFERYFTTKGEAGTGLGLPSVRDFAEAAGGAVDIASRPGEGSLVSIYLPIA